MKNTNQKKQIQNEIELLSNILFFLSKIIDLNDEVKEIENQFFCYGCKNIGRENFVYRNHFSGGQQFVCDNCHSTIIVSIQK